MPEETELNLKGNTFDQARYSASIEMRKGSLPHQLENLRNNLEWPIIPSHSAEIRVFFGETFLDNKGSHMGLDIVVPIDTPVTPPHGGKLLLLEDVNRNKAWGGSIGDAYVYSEENGLLQVFGHLDFEEIKSRLSDGQQIEQGQVIGKVGEFKGSPTFNHLHYGLSWSDKKTFLIPLINSLDINPLLLLKDLRK